jgi:hypothetical protein
MAQFASKKIARTFSRAFEQMVNFVAISKVGSPADTIRGLVQFCFVEPQGQQFESSASIAEYIDTLFGIRIPDVQVQSALDEMAASRVLLRPAGTNFVLAHGVRTDLLGRIGDARALEDRVKKKWLEDVVKNHPNLPIDRMWSTLRIYLSNAFKRHGIQAAALLDPTVETAEDYSKSLSVLLDEAMKGVFEGKDQEVARQAISDFMADIASNPERARYITQLADGAFNFYTLEVAPEVTKLLRSKLSSMILFLDTNFLFGILGLHNNLQVEVSHELLRAVKEYKLPFDLRYHEETADEIRATILHYGGNLGSQHWSSALSRAAITARSLSGIELKYHEQNARSSIDPKDFLRPYEHFDVLLKDRGIRVYNPREDRRQACIDLYQDYNKFLVDKHRDKPYKTVYHDATVLDTVRQLRSKAPSSLEAAALLITCDYWLFQFDRDSVRQNKHLACVLLPNVFWQILRPFVPSGTNFEKAFAETFALPEFRVVGSGASKACSKMLALFATYKEIPEETALRMLSNDVLLERLLATKDDEEFKACVEEAFVHQNVLLIEEKAAIARQLEAERKEREEDARRGKLLKAQIEQNRKETESLVKELALVKREASNLATAVGNKEAEIEQARANINKAEGEKAAKELEVQSEVGIRQKAERRAKIMEYVSAVSISILAVISFELSVRFLPIRWLAIHKNTLGLRFSIGSLLVAIIFGLCVPKRRNIFLVAGAIPIVVGIYKMLDG